MDAIAEHISADPATFASLPLLLARLIFLALPADARGRASCVSRAWRDVLADPALQPALSCVSFWYADLEQPALMAALVDAALARRLRKLVLQRCTPPPAALLARLLTEGGSPVILELRSLGPLDLRHCLTWLNCLGYYGLAPIVEALALNRHLRELDLRANYMREEFARERLLPAVHANTALRKFACVHREAEPPAAAEAEELRSLVHSQASKRFASALSGDDARAMKRCATITPPSVLHYRSPPLEGCAMEAPPPPPSLAAPAGNGGAAAAAAPPVAPSAPLAQAPAGAAEVSSGGVVYYDERAQRSGFEHALLAFWRSRGHATVPPCTMSWLRLAMLPWDLWERVQRFGGYDEVTNRKLWRTIGSSFGPPDSCTTISYQTKLAYTSVLLPFELETGRMHAPPRADAVPYGKGGVAGGGPRPPRPKPKKPRIAQARGWASSDEASSGDEAAAGFGSRRKRAAGAAGGGEAERSSSRSPSPAEEEWALCDACRKWRRLPRGVRGAALPERWTCERGTWGFRDTTQANAFTPLSCALAEPTSSGDAEVPPEDGAPEAVLWEGKDWIFAYGSAEAAERRAQGGASQPASQPPQRAPRVTADGAESAPPAQPPAQEQQQQHGAETPVPPAENEAVAMVE